ncbi:MAG TPA: TetR/AcrR family transcriptional regulator [Acidimicrobiales bacterium]|nr:TetR/AcrR family transcriptional regulator [Acidimicrobiales bacterium]
MPGAGSARRGDGARGGVDGRKRGRRSGARSATDERADTDGEGPAGGGPTGEGRITGRRAGDLDHADGRVLRGIRNREAVVEAFISLIEEGDPRPTARAIAARAGLSLRSVFQHFDDLEQIYEAAGRRQVRTLRPLLDPVPATLPLEARREEFLRRRVALLERLDPVARAARIREPFSAQLQANRAALVGLMREQCREVFSPELQAVAARAEAARSEAVRSEAVGGPAGGSVGGAGPDPASGVLTAIATASSWANWYHLRNDQELSLEEATSAVRLLLRGALAAVDSTDLTGLLVIADAVGVTPTAD